MDLLRYVKALLDIMAVLELMHKDKSPEEPVLILTNKGRYINVYPYNFKLILKAKYPDMNEKQTLTAYRKLGWLITPKNASRNTNIIKVKGKPMRMLTFKQETISLLQTMKL